MKVFIPIQENGSVEYEMGFRNLMDKLGSDQSRKKTGNFELTIIYRMEQSPTFIITSLQWDHLRTNSYPLNISGFDSIELTDPFNESRTKFTSMTNIM